MELFEDLKNQGQLYRWLDQQSLIQKPFTKPILAELIDEGLFDESEDENNKNSSEFKELAVFMIHVDSSEEDLIKLLEESHEPFKKLSYNDHFFDFLFIDANQKYVYGIGLGRRGKVFAMMSSNGEEFIETDIATERFPSMPYELINAIEQVLERLGQAFLVKDDMPFDPQLLQETLDAGPNDSGVYLLEGTEDMLSEEEIVNYIDEYETALNTIDETNRIFQIIFENISIESLNKGDF